VFTEETNISLLYETLFHDVRINIIILYNFILEDNFIFIFLQIILAKCVLLTSATLEIRAENAPDVTAEYAALFTSGVVNLAANTSCTSAGIFAINCTSYVVCTPVFGGFLEAEGTCPSQQNFDPSTKQCSSSYICSSCTKAEFFCVTGTSFTLCADVGVEVVSNQSCPDGYYCNQECTYPCLNYQSMC